MMRFVMMTGGGQLVLLGCKVQVCDPVLDKCLWVMTTFYKNNIIIILLMANILVMAN